MIRRTTLKLAGSAWLAAALAASVMVMACGSAASVPEAAEAATSRDSAGGTPADPGDAIAVEVAAIRQGVLSSLYSTSATLRADRVATVTSRTSGVLRALLVEEGDEVRENQVLARLEDDEQTIGAARATSTRDTLRREFERTQRLHTQGLISDEAYETVRRGSEDADHALALAELALSRTIIRAPFAGVVLRRHLDAGGTVADGTAVYDIADLTPLYADVAIPERHVLSLSPGQEVRMTVDASDTELAAVIERIAPLVDPATGTVKVTLAVRDAGGVRPGAFVRADIVTDTHQHATIAPRPALVAEGRRWHLFRLKDDNHVERLEVLLGFEEGDEVEILEVVGDAAALSAGSPIVVAGAPALTDGARVRVITP